MVDPAVVACAAVEPVDVEAVDGEVAPVEDVANTKVVVAAAAKETVAGVAISGIMAVVIGAMMEVMEMVEMEAEEAGMKVPAVVVVAAAAAVAGETAEVKVHGALMPEAPPVVETKADGEVDQVMIKVTALPVDMVTEVVPEAHQWAEAMTKDTGAVQCVVPRVVAIGVVDKWAADMVDLLPTALELLEVAAEAVPVASEVVAAVAEEEATGAVKPRLMR